MERMNARKLLRATSLVAPRTRITHRPEILGTGGQTLARRASEGEFLPIPRWRFGLVWGGVQLGLMFWTLAGPDITHAQNEPPVAAESAAASSTGQDPDDSLSIPETRVIAKPIPGPFPREALPDDASITANRTETLRSQVGSSMSVITEEQIRRSGQTTLLGVLRDAGVPGIDFAQSGAPGSVTSGFIRGANSAHTKVMMDGVPLNDPSSPTRNFDFGTFSLDNVERIEIIRGPQSTLYGSDAIGGAINIITKRGNGPAQFRSTSMGGTFGTWQQSLSVSGGTDQYYYSLSGSYLQSDGFSAATSVS